MLIGAFQCSSASRKFLNRRRKRRAVSADVFQCSSASRKFLNRRWDGARRCGYGKFQCSSASRKFLNTVINQSLLRRLKSFSALQRAENSSIIRCCRRRGKRVARFSALQRAENSSIRPVERGIGEIIRFSALQRAENSSMLPSDWGVSQFFCFSALQRAENSSMRTDDTERSFILPFQCSSASRKFLNFAGVRSVRRPAACFSALQRAENSSIDLAIQRDRILVGFSALQRAENSSIQVR